MFDRFTRHLVMALAEATLLALLIVALIAGTAFAARGGGGKPAADNGTIALSSPLVWDGDGDGAPDYGDRVTFDLTTSVAQPWVELDCFQGGTQVYRDQRGFFDGSLTGEVFILGTSAAWQSGAADCTAWLMKWTKRGWSKLASTSFHVDP